MVLPVKVRGRTGENGLEVDEDGAALVSCVPYPPFSLQKTIPFRQFLTDDGLSTGVSSMRTATATAAATEMWWVQAHNEHDRYITMLSFSIEGGAGKLLNFGSGAALINGCRLYFEHSTEGEIDLHDSLTTNWEFVRLGLGQPAFGNAADAFTAKSISTNNANAYIPVVDLKAIMPPFGIKLPAGTNHKLIMEVRDDTDTGTTLFDCVAYGFDRLP